MQYKICNLLKQIYLDNIHNVLDYEELALSQEVKETILDMWNKVDKIETSNIYYYDTKYYVNGDVWFQISPNPIKNYIRLHYSESYVHDPIYEKYNKGYFYSKYTISVNYLINEIISNHQPNLNIAISVVLFDNNNTF